MEWKVDTWQLATAPIRDFSSKAAFRENVSARILDFGNCWQMVFILETSTAVFPVPAPEMMAVWPVSVDKAASCWSLSMGVSDSPTADVDISAVGSATDGAHDGRVEKIVFKIISPFKYIIFSQYRHKKSHPI